MKYFVKLLPVEGTPENGDIVFKDNELATVVNVYPDRKSFELKFSYGNATYPKDRIRLAKMFLCSRDIQRGDKVYWFENTQWAPIIAIDGTIKTQEFCNKEIYFKNIGKVSPEANWLKEGMEFSEDEIKVQFIEGDFEGRQFTLSEAKAFYGNYPHKAPIHILLKGPCGHFH